MFHLGGIVLTCLLVCGILGKMSFMRYVVLLRGINVGGKMVKMETLRNLLHSMGFQNIKTLLNSGNVIFDCQENDSNLLTNRLEKAFEKEFGFHIDVLIRTMDDIVSLVTSEPFKDVTITPETRLYITFLSGEKKPTIQIPYESTEKDFLILATDKRYVITVITLSTNKNTTDMMKLLEKEFGKKITTRNWNTVQKIALLS